MEENACHVNKECLHRVVMMINDQMLFLLHRLSNEMATMKMKVISLTDLTANELRQKSEFSLDCLLSSVHAIFQKRSG